MRETETPDQQQLIEDFITGFAILDADGQNSGIAGHLTARSGENGQLLGHQYGLAFDEVDAAAVRQTDFSLQAAKRGWSARPWLFMSPFIRPARILARSFIATRIR